MIIQRIGQPITKWNKYKDSVSYYYSIQGRDTYSAKQNDLISTGKTASEAINNLLSIIN